MRPPQASLALDWSAELSKVRHVPSQVSQKDAKLTLGLSVGGAVLGKVAGGIAAKSAVGATSALLSKLSAPFVAKAVVGASGAAAGALGGPGGAVMGAAVGVAVDAAINSLHGLLNKGEFEREVRECVAATERDYLDVISVELDRAVDEWVDEAADAVRAPSKVKAAKAVMGVAGVAGVAGGADEGVDTGVAGVVVGGEGGEAVGVVGGVVEVEEVAAEVKAVEVEGRTAEVAVGVDGAGPCGGDLSGGDGNIQGVSEHSEERDLANSSR